MICAPIFDSVPSGNPSMKLKFGLMVGVPAANTTSSVSVTANVATGRRVTRFATHDQMRECSVPDTCIRPGQKAARPSNTVSAGISVSPAINIRNIAMASTGPIAWNDPNVASSSASMAATVVPPLEAMAGPIRRSDSCMACHRSGWRRSSSR